MIAHKVCPRCGQPAVLEIERCRRCGYAYPAVARVPPARGGRWAVAAMLAVVVLAGAFAAAFRVHERSLPKGTPPAATRQPGGGGLLESRSIGTGVGQAFTERPGTGENPTIEISDEEDAGMTFTLRSAAGRVYSMHIAGHGSNRLEVPAGEYALEVTSDDPMVGAGRGDATFRRYKEYSAPFGYSPFSEPIHVGD